MNLYVLLLVSIAFLDPKAADRNANQPKLPNVVSGVISLPPLAEQEPPLPTEQIKKLLFDLGDDSFAVRELATELLIKKGRLALRGLEDTASDKSLDIEMRSRAKMIMAVFYDVAALDDCFMPISCLPPNYRTVGDVNIVVKYRKFINKYYNLPGASSEADILATIYYKNSLLRAGAKKEEIIKMLTEMDWRHGYTNWDLSKFDDEGKMLPKEEKKEEETPTEGSGP